MNKKVQICLFALLFIAANCNNSRNQPGTQYYEKSCPDIKLNAQGDEFTETGGWDPNPVFDFLTKLDNKCTIERRKFAGNFEIVEKDYDFPVVWSAPPGRKEYEDILPLVHKKRLMCEYSEKKVELSNSITYSYDKHHITFKEYIDMMDKEKLANVEDILSMPAGGTWYNFGGNDWPFIEKHYNPPQGKGPHASPTFGIGRSGSGVPFHFHGPVYLELFYGQKIWFFSKYENKPKFDPEESTFKWFYNNGHEQEGIYVVVQQPGEIVYIPNKYWHATLNIGETVFVASFA